MSAVLEEEPQKDTDALELAADEAITACGGDLRDAIKALIVANQYLEEEIDALKTKTTALKATLVVLSENLSASRNEVIPGIETKVTAMLTEVGMPNALFRIANTRLPGVKASWWISRVSEPYSRA